MLNILISVNSRYLDKAETMLYSLRSHTKDEINVFLLNGGSLSKDEVDSFSKTLIKYKISLNVINLEQYGFEKLPLCNEQFSIEIYYRILAQFVLPEHIDRILWLDADLIIMKDISEFYNQNFDEKYLVVCSDSKNDKPWLKERKLALGLNPNYKYFNSGVILMDLKKLRENTLLENIVSKSQSLADKLLYPDQDILNYLYYNKVKYADWKVYNYQLVCLEKIPKKDLNDIAILHYTGPNKPWDPYKITSHAKYYWRVRLKQGHVISMFKAYFIRIQDITFRYFKEIKDIF